MSAELNIASRVTEILVAPLHSRHIKLARFRPRPMSI